MRYAKLGRRALSVSRLCLGRMSYGDPARRDRVLDEAAARPFFERALEAGVDFFDTADVHSDGATKLEHPDAAVAAVDLELSEEALAALAVPCRPHPVLGHR